MSVSAVSGRVVGRWRRVGLWAAGAALGLFALYLVGMNVLLRTHLLRKIMSATPAEMKLEYSSAYSFIPFHVHVTGLRLRGSDSHVQWILLLDRCDFRLHPLDIIKRRFHASHIRGDGLSFLIRLKLEPEAATPDVVSALPPVPGFSDPPLRDPGPPPPPLSDADYNLVSIQLDDVVAQHVREIWTQTLRFTGDMTVRGRWLFRPVRWLDVGPADVDVAALTVAKGPDHELFKEVHGHVVATIHPYDVRVPQGLELLEHVSLRTDLDGQVDAATFLSAIAEPSLPLKVVTANGPVHAHALVDHGRLASGTRLEAVLDHAHVTLRRDDVHANVAGRFTVVDETDGAVASAGVDLSGVQLAVGESGVVHASSASGSLVGIGLDLSHPTLKGVTFSASVEKIRAESVAPFLALLPSASLDLTSGSVQADAHADGHLDDSNASAALDLKVQSLELRQATNRVSANVNVHAEVRGASVRERRADVSGSVDLAQLSLVRERQALFKAEQLSAGVEAGHLSRAGLTGQVNVELPRGEVPDLHALALIAGLPASVQVVRGRAQAALHLGIDLASLTATGRASLGTEDLHLRLGTESFATNLSLAAVMKRSHLPDVTDISGTIVEATSDAGKGEEGWWGRLTLPEGSVRVKDGLAWFTRLRLEAKDAAPAQALVAGVTGAPRWLVETVSMNGLTGTADVGSVGSLFVVRSVDVRGAGSSVRVEFAKRDAHKTGAVVVNDGALHLGFNLSSVGSGFILFDAPSWFNRMLIAINEDPSLAWPSGEALRPRDWAHAPAEASLSADPSRHTSSSPLAREGGEIAADLLWARSVRWASLTSTMAWSASASPH